MVSAIPSGSIMVAITRTAVPGSTKERSATPRMRALRCGSAMSLAGIRRASSGWASARLSPAPPHWEPLRSAPGHSRRPRRAPAGRLCGPGPGLEPGATRLADPAGRRGEAHGPGQDDRFVTGRTRTPDAADGGPDCAVSAHGDQGRTQTPRARPMASSRGRGPAERCAPPAGCAVSGGQWQPSGRAARRAEPFSELLAIGAARARIARHHRRVAGELLVDAQMPRHHPDQRVEPVEAAGQRHGGVDARVLAGDVRLLVGEDQAVPSANRRPAKSRGVTMRGQSTPTTAGPGAALGGGALEAGWLRIRIGQDRHGAGRGHRPESQGASSAGGPMCAGVAAGRRAWAPEKGRAAMSVASGEGRCRVTTRAGSSMAKTARGTRLQRP